MLMMMRADEGYTPNEKCSLEEMVACALADDTDACLAACTGEEEEEQDPEEVKAGTLNVTMTSEKGGDTPNGTSSLPVATYTLKAADEDINITSLVVEQKWYGTDNTIDWAALFINGQRVSKIKNLDIDKEVSLNLTTAYTVKAGKSVDIELRVSTPIATTSKTDQFTIKLVDVTSSAEKVKLPSNTTSNVFKLVWTDTASITVQAPAALEAVKAWTTDAELFEIKVVWATDQDVEFNSITLMWSDKDLADYLDNLKLVVDSEVVATAKMNGKYLTFNLDNAYVIEKGKNVTFTVKADVKWWASATAYTFTMENIMDVLATATSYDAPVRVTPATLTFAGITISAGRVTIERTNPSLTEFTRNRKNVYLWSFTINNNAKSNLTLEGFKLTITDKWTNGTTTVANYIDTIKVKYGSTSAAAYELTPNAAHTLWTSDDEQSLNSKLTVYVYADIEDVDITTAETESFQMSIAAITDVDVVDDDDNKVTDMSLPASWLAMTATKSSINLTNITLAAKSYAKWAEDIEAVSFKVKTNDVAWIKVKKLVFTANTAISSNEIRSASVFVGEDEYPATVSANTVKFTNAITLDKNTTTTFKLVIDLASNPNIALTPFTYSLTSIEAEDTSADRNDLSDNAVAGIAWRAISIIANWTLTVTMENVDNNKNDKSILAWNEAVIAEYALQAKYEDVRAKTIVVTFNEDITARVNDVKLYYWEEEVASSPVLTAASTATFNDVNLLISQTKTPLTIKVSTLEMWENGVTPVVDAKVTDIAFDGMYGKETWNPIAAVNLTKDSKVFDVVPATVAASIVSSNNAQTKINLFVDKGNNVKTDDSDIKVYVKDLTVEQIANNGWLQWASLATADKNIGYYDNTHACANWGTAQDDWCILAGVTLDDFELAAWDNEITVTYVVNWAMNNPSYTLDLTNVKYVTDATHTFANHTAMFALTNPFSNRMKALNLVTK